ncbi:Cytochrome P450 71D8 [Morella rubra]|uniref:Cytochrome P450 71D8 n=1 Tax=Morella rubra TaxID=262757 RepID=A0A6A1WU51_9ROSI|nr:Cytochrome P450 71D8 [Morella rubra]KAB1228276.1 Cytochrome P450 71D8 [Morella rubra]
MLQFLSLPILIWLLFLSILLWKKFKAKSQSHKLPPGPWQLPVLGNLHQMAFSNKLTYRILKDLADKYGPIMRLQLGEMPGVVISSPELAKDVLIRHDTAFAQRRNFRAVDMISYNSSVVFAPYCDYWRQIRKVYVMELLSAKRVQSFRSIREEEVENLLETLSLSGGLPIDLSEKIFSLIHGINSRAAFGKKYKHQKELISLLKDFNILSGGFSLLDFFPSLVGFLTGKTPAMLKICQKVDAILDDTLNDHLMERSASTSACTDHIVHVLLNLKEAGELEFNLTSKHVKAIILELFFVGSDTSATTIEWAMSELLKNPKAMEKAQAEVRQVFDGRNIDDNDEKDIQKLDFLKTVVKETLRLYPPTPLTTRKSGAKCEIGGYEITEDTTVYINIWGLARDPNYWVDANCFHPERFLGSSVDLKGNNFEFLAFGAGRRICPGITYALANIELTLCRLLYHFNWKLPNGIKPEELDMEVSPGLTYRKKILFGFDHPDVETVINSYVDGYTLTEPFQKFVPVNEFNTQYAQTQELELEKKLLAEIEEAKKKKQEDGKELRFVNEECATGEGSGLCGSHVFRFGQD